MLGLWGSRWLYICMLYVDSYECVAIGTSEVGRWISYL